MLCVIVILVFVDFLDGDFEVEEVVGLGVDVDLGFLRGFYEVGMSSFGVEEGQLVWFDGFEFEEFPSG